MCVILWHMVCMTVCKGVGGVCESLCVTVCAHTHVCEVCVCVHEHGPVQPALIFPHLLPPRAATVADIEKSDDCGSPC